MNILEQWTAAVGAGLSLDPGPLSTAEIKAVLEVARDVAHAVDRPAAPLTAYLLGVAVGRGLTLPDASDRVRTLAAGWPESTGPAVLPDSYGAAVTARAGSPSRRPEVAGFHTGRRKELRERRTPG